MNDELLLHVNLLQAVMPGVEHTIRAQQIIVLTVFLTKGFNEVSAFKGLSEASM